MDTSDLVRFAPLAIRQACKKAVLLERDSLSWRKKFFVLFGNLLYSFEAEDGAKLCGIEFLENSTVKPGTVGEQATMSIATVGGKNIVIGFSSSTERQEWIDAIEKCKFISLSRRLEDSEASAVQLNHRVEQQDIQNSKVESLAIETDQKLSATKKEKEVCELKVRNLEAELRDLKCHLRDLEAEKAILLKSRGITPKKVPLWALNEAGREGTCCFMDSVKIWTGTWNLTAHEPFGGMDKSRAQTVLQPFVPAGYDLYVLGVQESVSESVFECLDGLLAAEGVLRLRLDVSANWVYPIAQSSAGDQSKVVGKNEGMLNSQKFIGVAVYIRQSLANDTHLLRVVQKSFVGKYCRGAVCVALSILGRSILFVSCQFDSKKNDVRRDQFRDLIVEFGSALAEPGFHLNEQFHHMIWMGDFGYSLVDTSGQPMASDVVIRMLEDNLNRTLFDSHDQLNRDKRAQQIFYGFREPTPFPTFFPTFKKLENRRPLDYTSSTWPRMCYETQAKQSIFKGSSSKDLPPSFADRILYFSMSDLAEDLLPESKPQDMLVHLDRTIGQKSDNVRPTSNQPDTGDTSNGAQKGGIANSHVTLKGVIIDNYQSINDGEAMTVSSHSPVFATFLLRLRHDHDDLRQHAASIEPAAVGSISSILSALHDVNSKLPRETLPARKEKISTIPGDSINTPSNESSSVPRTMRYRYSLLQPGPYTIRLSCFKLVWGTHDDVPFSMQLLFPAPFETDAGEQFTDFFSESESEVPSENVTESTSSQTTPSKKPKAFGQSPASPVRRSSGLPAASMERKIDGGWARRGTSASGTCIALEFLATTSSVMPGLQLTWKGDEPLDRLHVVLKVGVAPSYFSTEKSISSHGVAPEELSMGHCAIGLEQLCKVAMVSSGGISGCVSVARLLLREGLPLYCIDQKTIQREQVTLTCMLELLAPEVPAGPAIDKRNSAK